MRKIQLSNYRMVYGLLWRTYGQSSLVRLSFLSALLSRVCKFVILPIVGAQLITELAARDYNQARTWVIVFACTSAAIGILSPLTRYIALKGENPVYATGTRKFFDELLRKDVVYFNENMAGYITTATRQYNDNLLNMQRELRESYLGLVFAMFVPIIVIAYFDLWLGFITLILSLIQTAYLLWASQVIIPYRQKSREIYRRNSGKMSDAITNIVAIKSTSQEKIISKSVGEQAVEEARVFEERYKKLVKLISWREVITVTFFFVLFWATVSRLSADAIPVTAAVLVVTYSFTILNSIYDLSNAIDQHDNFVDMIIPALELLDEPNRVNDPDKPLRLGKVRGDVTFDNISFAYKEDNMSVKVFENLNLQIPAGQRVGIVGLSGAGKSTLAKLLLRFEDVQDGSIKLDGKPITKLRQSDLRRNIAYVPQEPLLFHDTIAENIKLAKLDASQEEIDAAARAAYATNFIAALPNGMDSIVGERGVKLSGGQKQRIAIARAVLQDTPIVLLDEATSALDSESEQIIKESFSTILKGRTSIVIAHRLSTIADLDRIVLLHEGRIIEDGDHKSLLKKNGVYAKLWRRQRVHPEDLEIKDKKLDRITGTS